MDYIAQGKIASTYPKFSIAGWLFHRLASLSVAYRDYRQFKSLDEQRLHDIGISRDEQARASFMSFLARSQE